VSIKSKHNTRRHNGRELKVSERDRERGGGGEREGKCASKEMN